MLISWRRQFAFLHWPKTGGTSLTRALAPHARWRDRLAYFAPARRLHRTFTHDRGDDWRLMISGYDQHVFLWTLTRDFGRETLAPLRVITFSRNPYSWAWSHFRHIRRHPAHPLHDAPEAAAFGAYLRWLCRKGTGSHVDQLRPQAGAAPRADFIGRFEAFNEDASALSAFIGAPLNVGHFNASSSKPFDVEAVFGKDRQRFVDFYEEDFAFFGYSPDPARAFEAPDQGPCDIASTPAR